MNKVLIIVYTLIAVGLEHEKKDSFIIERCFKQSNALFKLINGVEKKMSAFTLQVMC